MNICMSPQAGRGKLNFTSGPDNTTSGPPFRAKPPPSGQSGPPPTGPTSAGKSTRNCPSNVRPSASTQPTTSSTPSSAPTSPHGNSRTKTSSPSPSSLVCSQQLKPNRSAAKQSVSPPSAFPRAAGNSRHGPPGGRPPVGTYPPSRKNGKSHDITAPVNRQVLSVSVKVEDGTL